MILKCKLHALYDIYIDSLNRLYEDTFSMEYFEIFSENFRYNIVTKMHCRAKYALTYQRSS